MDYNQDSFVSRLPVDDDQKKALLYAFYNTLLFTLFGISLASIFAVYQMLYMFLMPILWASLLGTMLFPLKRLISANLKGWLDQLDQQDRPLLIGLALLPVHVGMAASNRVYETTLSFTGVCIAVGYFTLKIFCYYDAFTTLLNWIARLYAAVDSLVDLFTLKLVFVLVLLYGLGIGAWIYLQDQEHVNKKLVRVLSLPIWFLLLSHLADFFGPFRVPIFALICILLALISAGLIEPQSRWEESEQQKTTEETEIVTGKGKSGKEAEGGQTKSTTAAAIASPVGSESRLDQALSSDAHLRIIGSLCALLLVVNHDILLIFILVPLTLVLLLNLGERLGLNQYLQIFLLSIRQQAVDVSSKFAHIFVAGPLRKFFHLLFTSDRMFITGLQARVDLISSVCVMAVLAVGSLFFSLFMAFQLHGETVHLVKLGGNVLSSNPDWLRYAMNYTGGTLAEHDLDNYMEQAYQQGRSWLASNIRSWADPKDPTRADQLEEQAKLLVDNLYRLWEERGQRIFQDPLMAEEQTAIRKQWSSEDAEFAEENGGHFLSRLIQNANLGLWKSALKAVVTENLEIFWTISQSLWHVLLMNISLLTTVLVALLAMLLGFGFELLNFLIECIVFLTAVYYLLANSSNQWLPLHWVNDFSASLQIQRLANSGGDTNGKHKRMDVSKAVEGAIRDVFILSSKMAIFYGLYTYFVHSLFTLNIVFIPSVMAALLAAIPIFPPYAVALFGVFELWLVRGEGVAALVFAGASIAPLFFADPAFYREVKGSHPYITGLTVVGGIYWLGLQGAIIGPIILCLMIALLNVYAEFANHQGGASTSTA